MSGSVEALPTSVVRSTRAVLPCLRLGEMLGTGAGGWVIGAVDERTDQRVAVKILAGETLRDPAARDRMRVEADIIMTCRHPNLIRGVGFHEHPEILLLLMERLDGPSLLARPGPRLSAKESCAVMAAVADAVHCVHRHGFLHGDVKPGNVLFDSTGRHRLIDFGLARPWPFPMQRHVMGTPGYLPPEALLGRGSLVPASDVYALGMMAYELLAGHAPYLSAGGPIELVRLHLGAKPMPLAGVAPHLPVQLHQLVMAAIEKRVEDRIESAGELAARLARIMAVMADGDGPAQRLGVEQEEVEQEEVEQEEVEQEGVHR